MIKESELVLASDGSLYHIHLTGKELADDVILVGDPERVNMFKPIFKSIEFESYNRELHAVTGNYKDHRITVLSTGMGTDNIDIVLTELDAAANMDLEKRIPNTQHRTLNLIRIGTSGSLQANVPIGSLVASSYAIGLDGLLNYYQHKPEQLEPELTNAFCQHTKLASNFAQPYTASASRTLLGRVTTDMYHGITVTAPGFYAPQGRNVRIAPAITNLNERLASFQYNGLPIINLEMETSAIYGLSAIMGHNPLTVCLIIANRANGTFLNEYHAQMQIAIETILDRMIN